MSKGGRGRHGTRAIGMRIAPKFAIAMTASLVVVLGLFIVAMLNATRGIVDTAVRESRDQAAVAKVRHDDGSLKFERPGTEAQLVEPRGLNVLKARATFTVEGEEPGEGTAYWVKDRSYEPVLLAPDKFATGDPIEKLYGLFFAMTALVLIVAALVALGVATRVAGPINELVDDVRSIANGNLAHRVRARGSGEVGLLGNAIDRMTESLRDARDAEVELSVREREREVAMEVQDALRPTEIPVPDGYAVASEHVGSAEPGGDFHDFVVADDGRMVFFACDVSGTGVPGALVGAMARAYLKTAFAAGGPLEDTLKAVNRTIAGEVRSGMYVTVLAAALDADTHELEVASAGHKLPLVHWSAADGSIRAIQPDGIALGFDKGPVFDRGISVRHVPMDEGDRVAIAGTGAVQVVNSEGAEIGEKRFYKLFARGASEEPADALDAVLTALEAYADEEPFPNDVSLIVLGRST